jgi:hypothetical protein
MSFLEIFLGNEPKALHVLGNPLSLSYITNPILFYSCIIQHCASQFSQ